MTNKSKELTKKTWTFLSELSTWSLKTCRTLSAGSANNRVVWVEGLLSTGLTPSNFFTTSSMHWMLIHFLTLVSPARCDSELLCSPSEREHFLGQRVLPELATVTLTRWRHSSGSVSVSVVCNVGVGVWVGSSEREHFLGQRVLPELATITLSRW